MLTEDQRERIIQALEEWAHLAPDEPVLGFMQSESDLKTPKELVRDVRENTPDGIALMEIMEHGVQREGLSRVIRRLRNARPEEMSST